MIETGITTAILRATAILEEALRKSPTAGTGSLTFHFHKGEMRKIVPSLGISRQDLERALDPRIVAPEEEAG